MSEILIIIYKCIACHMLGDYVLQSEFIATTKGTNTYHLIVHSFLYTVPFAFVFGINIVIPLLFLIHLYIDALKATFHKIGYVADQIAHYGFLFFIYLYMFGIEHLDSSPNFICFI